MAGRVRVGTHLIVVALFAAMMVAIPTAAGAAGGTFIDDDDSIFEDDIEWLAGEGITKGCNPPTNNRFCPDGNVTRGQMAAFLTRALDLPAAVKDHFTDDAGSVFEDDINRIADAGITKGCNPPSNTLYCPSDHVTREVMAAFLVRALELTDVGFGNQFVDDNGSIFEDDIAKLAAAGITKGCNPPTNNRFCPTDKVTRGVMAAFLRRALTCALPQAECDALEAIYDALDGPNWDDNSGWKTVSNPCTWFGVECKTGHVQTLDLTNNSLSGALPADIVDLTELQKLKLNRNSISGSIPAFLTTMTSLHEIRIADNDLTGSIPAGLGGLGELRRIELGRNMLTGSIPTEIGSLPHMLILSLSSNGLTGSIPSELGDLSKLADLSLDGNDLSGTIPAELGNINRAMNEFDLHDNDLSGEVPASLQNLDGTSIFELNGQSGCLTVTGNAPFEAWLDGVDPLWDDGCP